MEDALSHLTKPTIFFLSTIVFWLLNDNSCYFSPLIYIRNIRLKGSLNAKLYRQVPFTVLIEYL